MANRGTSIPKHPFFGVLVMYLLLSTSIPIQASWNDDFSSANQENWKFGSVDWTLSVSSGTISQLDNGWVIQNDMLKFIPDKPREAYGHACRGFSETIKRVEFDVLTVGGIWGVFVGSNYNLYQSMDITDITFSGILLQLRVTRAIIVRSPGAGTLVVIDFFNGIDQYPRRAKSRPVDTPDIAKLFNSWMTVSLAFSPNYLTWETTNSAGKTNQKLENLDSNYDEYDTICLIGYYGSEINYDNVKVRTKLPPFLTLIALVTTMSVLGAFQYQGYRTRKGRVRRLMSKYPNLNKSSITRLEREFKPLDTALISLLNDRDNQDPKYINEVKKSVPTDLLDFKYILHPTRLLITKVLFSEFEVTSSVLREILGLSSGDFSTHRRSLLENGYIKVENSFSITGGKKQTLYLTAKGKRVYSQVFELLNSFVEDHSPYYYLLNAKKFLKEYDDLYPSE